MKLDDFNSMLLFVSPLSIFFAFLPLPPSFPSSPSPSTYLIPYKLWCISSMKVGHSSLEMYTHRICFDIPWFITWKEWKIRYMAAAFCWLDFFCLIVCLILVWAIFVSVAWMFVSYSLPGVVYFEYKYAKLLKMWLLKVAQKSDWKFIKNCL